MFYVILTRILQRHALLHLAIPLVVGVLVEAAYTHIFGKVYWRNVPLELVSGHRIALYAGVIAAYFIVIVLRVRSETNIGLRRIELHDLAARLHGAKSLFTVAPTPLEEWFDPAAQVYFATLLGERLNSDPTFRYERVLLFPSRKARKYLDSDYLDGYFARCLIDIHKRLEISLYFLEWGEIAEVLRKLTPEQKVSIRYYSSLMARLPEFVVKILILPVRRRRVRLIAGGVIETSAGTNMAFGFKKRENVVDVEVQPEARAKAYLRFVELLTEVLYESPGKVKPLHDFTQYYSG